MSDQAVPEPPLPHPDPDSAPYWSALREHRVTIQRCGDCGERQLYFRAVCRRCWSRALEIVDCAGTGTVHSCTTLFRVGDRYLRQQAPYVLAIVELDEGPRVVTRIDAAPEAVTIGDRVEARYVDLDGTTLLHFQPAP